MGNSTDRVAVVGAGHIGIACAHYLEQQGYEVTVIDQGDIGGACSRANCGFLVPSHVLPLTTPANLAKGLKSVFQPRAPFRVRPQVRSALYKWMFQFARRCTHRQMLATGKVLQQLLDASLREYRSLLNSPDLSCEWKDDGLLFVFQSDDALEDFSKTNALLSDEFDLQARRIDGADLGDLDAALADGLAGAYCYEDDGYLRPDKLNSAWVERLTARGVTFLDHCKLSGIEKKDGKVTGLVTPRGRIEADRYVFAVGAWSSKLASDLECDIPVEPGKDYSVTMSAPTKLPKYPMLFPEAHIGVTPFSDSFRIGSMMEFAGFDDSIPAFRIEQLIDSARPYLDISPAPVIEDKWYGWRPMTWDGLPIVGRVPRLSNALLATGHNMLGLTLAPVTGKAIADLVAEKPATLPLDALSPTRFS
jgi:D-amino-acid dehydrogenase